MKIVPYFRVIATRNRARVFCLLAVVTCLSVQSPAMLFGGRGGRGGSGTTSSPGGSGSSGSKRWAEPVGATVDLRVKMPAWTKGWLKAGVSWQGTPQLNETAKLNGRDISAQSHHALLVRTKAGEKGPHSWKGKELIPNDAWDKKVYRESWASINDLSGYSSGGNGQSPSGADQEYRRFTTYVKWSD